MGCVCSSRFFFPPIRSAVGRSCVISQAHPRPVRAACRISQQVRAREARRRAGHGSVPRQERPWDLTLRRDRRTRGRDLERRYLQSIRASMESEPGAPDPVPLREDAPLRSLPAPDGKGDDDFDNLEAEQAARAEPRVSPRPDCAGAAPGGPPAATAARSVAVDPPALVTQKRPHPPVAQARVRGRDLVHARRQPQLVLRRTRRYRCVERYWPTTRHARRSDTRRRFTRKRTASRRRAGPRQFPRCKSLSIRNGEGLLGRDLLQPRVLLRQRLQPLRLVLLQRPYLIRQR